MSVSFEARYSHQFLADFKKLHPPIQRRILEAIERVLLVHPFRHRKKLVDKTGPARWRFRMGEYRIHFEVEGRVLRFHRVRQRQEIYE